MATVELGAYRVRAQQCRERSARLEQLHRCERPRIGEHDARTVVELEHESRKARELFSRRGDDPVPRHAKMDVQHRAIIEDGELVLATTVDALDRSPAKSSQRAFGELTPDIGMKDFGGADARAAGRTRERTRRMLDLGEFRHERERRARRSRAQAYD